MISTATVMVRIHLEMSNSECRRSNDDPNPKRKRGVDPSRARLPFTSRSDVKGEEADPSIADCPLSPVECGHAATESDGTEVDRPGQL